MTLSVKLTVQTAICSKNSSDVAYTCRPLLYGLH